MENKLKLMKFWLFGIFVLVLAGVTAFIYYPANGNVLLSLQSGWSIWGGTGILCILVFYFYKWFLNRK